MFKADEQDGVYRLRRKSRPRRTGPRSQHRMFDPKPRSRTWTRASTRSVVAEHGAAGTPRPTRGPISIQHALQ
jgi:hypothetical protein